MIHGTVPDNFASSGAAVGHRAGRSTPKISNELRSLYLRRRRAFWQPHRSMRLKKTAANHSATVIIQHNASDIDILPAFPASAK
jgi:hypothetical protein